MANKPVVVRRWLSPSVPLTLELAGDNGSKDTLALKVSFDMNAAALVQEYSGFSLLNGQAFKHIGEAKVQKVILWAGLLANQPEYGTAEGLEAVGSYLTLVNAEAAIGAMTEAYLLFIPKDRADAIRAAAAEAEAREAAGLPREEVTPPLA